MPSVAKSDQVEEVLELRQEQVRLSVEGGDLGVGLVAAVQPHNVVEHIQGGLGPMEEDLAGVGEADEGSDHPGDAAVGVLEGEQRPVVDIVVAGEGVALAGGAEDGLGQGVAQPGEQVDDVPAGVDDSGAPGERSGAAPAPVVVDPPPL